MPFSDAAPGLWHNVRAMPPAAWVLCGGSFVNRFGSFVLIFLVIWLTEEGYSPAQAGAAVSSYGVGALVASLLGGYLADRIGRRNAIAVSMFSAAATMLALSQAETFPVVVALSMLAGLTSELYRPASAALLADLVPPERRLTAYALYRLAINFGFAAGAATAGLLAERSFLLLFLVEASSSAAFGIAALLFLPEGLRSLRTGERPGGSFAPSGPTGLSSSSSSPRCSPPSFTSSRRAPCRCTSSTRGSRSRRSVRSCRSTG